MKNEKRFDPTACRLLAELRKRAGRTGDVTASIMDVAKTLKRHHLSVRRSIRVLEAAGMLRRSYNGGAATTYLLTH